MTSSLSNVVNNLSEGIHRIICKFGHDDKNCETCGTKYKYCNCFLEYMNFKDNLVGNKCLCFNKNYQHKFDEKLKERFFNFLTTTIITLFYRIYFYFILMNMWMIAKNSMKSM